MNNENTNLGKLDLIKALVETINTNVSSSSNLQKTAFDELLIAEPVPQVQLQFPYNINTDLITPTISGSGTVTQSNNKARISTGAAINSMAMINSKNAVKYNPGQGALIRFTTIFSAGVVGSIQLAGIGDEIDGFFFGCDDETFGILRRHNGSDDWITQSSWNGDLADGSGTLPIIDFTKGNVFQIRYQWLGFGAIKFFIENPENGEYILVHTIRYANSSSDTSINNPTLPLYLHVENTTNDTDVVIESGSMAGFTEGIENSEASALTRSKTNTKSSITTENSILTIRNKEIYNSIANRVRIKPIFLSISNEGTKDVEFKFILNATLGGSPSYNDIDANNSVIEYDIAGTTIAGGDEIFNFELAKNTSDKLIIPIKLFLNPGETLTISANSSSSAIAKVGLVWEELF